MAVLYALITGKASARKNIEIDAISEVLKWPGAVKHKISFHAFSGGLILHPGLHSDLSEFLFSDHEEQVLVLP